MFNDKGVYLAPETIVFNENLGAFTSFVSKTAGMVFLTWLGVSYIGLDFKIYIPLLTFFWFITHILEAFIINSAMKKNIDK